MLHVISHEGGDKIIGMVVARLHPHVDGNSCCGTRVHKTKKSKERFLSETAPSQGIQKIKNVAQLAKLLYQENFTFACPNKTQHSVK